MNAPNADDDEARGSSSSSGERAVFEHLRALERDIATAIREAAVLGSLQVDRARIWLRESAWSMGTIAIAGLAIVVLVVLALVDLSAGLCGAFTALFGRAWAGSLAGGIVGLTIAVVAMRQMRRRMAIAGLERLRGKYEPPAPPSPHV